MKLEIQDLRFEIWDLGFAVGDLSAREDGPGRTGTHREAGMSIRIVFLKGKRRAREDAPERTGTQTGHREGASGSFS